MVKSTLLFKIFLIFFVLIQTVSGQIKLREIPSDNNPLLNDFSYFSNECRKTTKLNKGWILYTENHRDEATEVKIPFNFAGNEDVICEKEIDLLPSEILNKKVTLDFLGVNYSADILFNDVVLYKHPGGEIPFSIDIPNEIIKTENKNILIIKLNFSLSYDRSIPLNKGFLMPENIGGITRDIFLKFTPMVNISKFSKIL